MPDNRGPQGPQWQLTTPEHDWGVLPSENAYISEEALVAAPQGPVWTTLDAAADSWPVSGFCRVMHR